MNGVNMDFFITLYLAFICNGNNCNETKLVITRDAMAIASCESGDGLNYGTYNFTARSKTKDGGAWQFNDKTYHWLNGYANAENDSPENQYDTFVRLWNNGKGWRHWSASKSCWSQWIRINENERAVWK